MYYFSKCDARTKVVTDKEGGAFAVPDPAPYTIEGLCNHLNIDTETFRNWCRRDSAIGAKARMLRQRIAENRVTGALDGRQNSSFARFMLTNNHSYDYREKEPEGVVNESIHSILELARDSWKQLIKQP